MAGCSLGMADAAQEELEAFMANASDPEARVRELELVCAALRADLAAADGMRDALREAAVSAAAVAEAAIARLERAQVIIDASYAIFEALERRDDTHAEALGTALCVAVVKHRDKAPS